MLPSVSVDKTRLLATGSVFLLSLIQDPRLVTLTCRAGRLVLYGLAGHVDNVLPYFVFLLI